MDFLVRMELKWPDGRDRGDLEALIAQETARGNELVAAGLVQGIWRLPGRRGNVSVWSAADASELHRAIQSLPLFAWLDIDVQALAGHPVRAPFSVRP